MDIFYVFLVIILIGLMALCIFVLGALFMRRIILEAYDEARYDRAKQDYYWRAGVRNDDDPKPYFPPRITPMARPRTPRNRILPGMGALDRRLREGKRGTVMWRAGDRR